MWYVKGLFKKHKYSHDINTFHITGLEGNPPVTGGFSSQRASSAEFFVNRCKTMELSVIWDAMVFMWRHFNKESE